MSLLAPWALAWAAANAVVVVLYMLRRRERELPVSALFLWEQVPPDAMSRVARWLPRTDLLLWAQILTVLVMALALSSPVVTQTRPAGATAIVVDTSLKSAPAGRMEEARRVAREVVQDSAGPWALVSWGTPPELIVAPTDSSEEIMTGIAQLSYRLAARPPLGQALALAPDGWDRITVITGAAPDDAPVEVIGLSPVDNVAIDAFAVRAQPDDSGYQALVTVRNDTREYQDVVVTVRDIEGGRAFQQARLLEPDRQDTFAFPLWGRVGPAYAAELNVDDAFPYDDVRYYALDMPASLRVRWIGDEDRYLWAALQATAPVERAAEPPWDLTVVVRRDIEEEIDGPCLLVEGGLPEAPRGELVPANGWTMHEDMLLEHVDVQPWSAAAVHELSLPEEVRVPLELGGLPALARWSNADGRRVALTVQLTRSNLPLTVGFPVLLRNALAWLIPGPEGSTVTVGESIQLPPDAVMHTPRAEMAEAWVPQEPGLFEMRDGDRLRYIAANVPRVTLNTPPEETAASRAPTEHQAPIWPWVVAVGLVLLGGEWYLAKRSGV